MREEDGMRRSGAMSIRREQGLGASLLRHTLSTCEGFHVHKNSILRKTHLVSGLRDRKERSR